MSNYYYEISYQYKGINYETDSEIETYKSANDRAKRLKGDKDIKYVKIIKKEIKICKS